ncbi:MAG: hypothetical protein AAF393_18675 [Pseudomonadota bacterium]
MQLSHWPITREDTARFQYDGGAPDDFLWRVLDDIGDCITRGTDGSNLAPELLDPFVFAQFVTGLQGKYTVNGTPFANNWRFMPCATRMAERLGADELTAALREGEAEMATWDQKDLEAHDRGMLRFDDPIENAKSEQLFARFDTRFEPFVGAGECSFGTSRLKHKGGDKLLAALGDWVTEAMPREVLPDQAAVKNRLQANHDWACDHVENYEHNYTKFYVGEHVSQMLKSMGLRLDKKYGRSFWTPHELQVIPYEIFTTNGSALIRFDFGDGTLLADPDTMIERTRIMFDKPQERAEGLVPYLMLADAPSVALDMKTFKTHAPSMFKPNSKTLKYKQ